VQQVVNAWAIRYRPASVGRVDFLRATVTVAEQITRGHGGSAVTGPPKSRAGRRTLAAPEALMTMLAAHLKCRGLSVADPHSRLFVSRDGTDLEYSNFRDRNWLPACRKAGFPGLTFHDLRRLAATTLLAEGVDVKTAQTRLGHASPQITLALYAQANEHRRSGCSTPSWAKAHECVKPRYPLDTLAPVGVLHL
jgi:integrase